MCRAAWTNWLANDFRALGFTVLRDGKHTEMGTQNALVVFQDGTFIELPAPIPGRTLQGFAGRLGEKGFAGFRLRAGALADDLLPAAATAWTVSGWNGVTGSNTHDCASL